jgi:hypothetical protein
MVASISMRSGEWHSSMAEPDSVLLVKENIMSIGAIGAMGSLGAGTLMGTGFSGQAGSLTPGHMVTPFGTANAEPRSANAVPAAGQVPSAKVDISDAARSALSSDGLQSGAGMADLAQALILALLLQLLQGN